MADKRIFQLEEEGFLDDITDKVYMWLDKKANEGELQEPSWKFKADVFLKILNNFATKFVPNVATVEGKCYWHGGELFVCNVAYTGDWVPGNFTATSIDELFERKDVVSALQSAMTSVQSDISDLQDEAVRQFQDPNSPTTQVNIVDESSNILATIDEDGIHTKNLKNCPDVTEDFSEDNSKKVNIVDESGNILATISEDGIRTLNSGATNSKELNVGNSDCITIIGSSFGVTTAFPTNKHWSGIMSMFTDYRIQNLSIGGSNIVNDLYYLRSGSWKPDGKYVLITNNENIDSINDIQFLKALDNLCVTLKGMGIEPIVATNYHATQTQSSEFLNYAKQNNLMFWDCSNYSHDLTKGIYRTFDDGSHLRKRNAPLTAFGYMPHLLEMERPLQSMKVFRVRSEFTVNSLDDLVFGNNFERAKIYKEIEVSSNQSNDEYNKLKNKNPITFTDYALVSCVLPVIGKDLRRLSISVTASADVSVYVKNTVSEPYPNPSGVSSTGVRFSISDTISVPSDGDVYTVGGVNYTVKSVVLGENGYYCTIYCTPNTVPSSTTGTMTVVSQVSGSTGDSSIDFDLVEEVTFDLSTFIYADTQGHWVELEEDSSGKFPVDDIVGSVNIDKVDFLVVSQGTFTISDINVKFTGERTKNNFVRKEHEWVQNEYIHSDEILPETTFGAVGDSTTFWVDDNGDPITSVANYETTASGSPVFPEGCASEIVVNDELSMNCSLTSSELDKFGDMYLEIWCRYFPPAPTPYTQESDTNVSSDSYDFNKLHIVGSFAGNSKRNVEFDFDIGLFWQIVRVPIRWFYQHYLNDSRKFTGLNLRLSSSGYGVEICKTSLKYK